VTMISLCRSFLRLTAAALFLIVGCSGGGNGPSSGDSAGSSMQVAAAMVYPDPASHSLAAITTNDGQVITVSGTKDENGTPISLTSIRTSFVDKGFEGEIITTYNEGRPERVSAGTGEALIFTYVSDTRIDIAVLSREGQVLGSVSYNPQAGSISSAATAHNAVMAGASLVRTSFTATSIPPLASASTVSGTILKGRVNVTCDGFPFDAVQPEGYFQPSLQPSVPLNQPLKADIQFTPTGNQGEFDYAYNANPFGLLDPPTRAAIIAKYLDDANKVLKPICDVFKESGFADPTRIAAITAQVTFFAPQIGPIVGVMLGSLKIACTVADFMQVPGLAVKINELAESYTADGQLQILLKKQGKQFFPTSPPPGYPVYTTPNNPTPDIAARLPLEACVTIQFNYSTYSQSSGTANIDVIRTGPGQGPVSGTSSVSYNVNITATPDEAIMGQDYTLTPSTLNFAPGQSQKSLSVQILPNSARTTDRVVHLYLSNPVNAVLGTRSTAILTIPPSQNSQPPYSNVQVDIDITNATCLKVEKDQFGVVRVDAALTASVTAPEGSYLTVGGPGGISTSPSAGFLYNESTLNCGSWSGGTGSGAPGSGSRGSCRHDNGQPNTTIVSANFIGNYVCPGGGYCWQGELWVQVDSWPMAVGGTATKKTTYDFFTNSPTYQTCLSSPNP
jgi:hypothetical protein